MKQSREFGVISVGISPELSRNDNISDFLKLGEIVDTFDIGSLSVRPIYTDGRWSRSVCRGLGSIYGRDLVHIALPLPDEHVSILRASKCESSETREANWSQRLRRKKGNCRKLDGNLASTINSTQRTADYLRWGRTIWKSRAIVHDKNTGGYA